MKKLIIIVLFITSVSGFSQNHEWLTSLEVAKRLATIQDKMIWMMWEESTIDPMPILINDEKGKEIFVENMFTNEYINKLIWDYFVPVKVSESQYVELFETIKDNSNNAYIDKFNDDTIKILDVNGYILNTEPVYSYNYFNITEFILKYSLNTSLLKGEYLAYKNQKGLFSALRLASEYLDFAALAPRQTRKELITLSNRYFDEVSSYLSKEQTSDNQSILKKLELQKIKQQLILDNPKKVLRQLKRLDLSTFDASNKETIAFLYFTAHLLVKDEKSASEWRSKLSLVNLTKASQIINSNL